MGFEFLALLIITVAYLFYIGYFINLIGVIYVSDYSLYKLVFMWVVYIVVAVIIALLVKIYDKYIAQGDMGRYDLFNAWLVTAGPIIVFIVTLSFYILFKLPNLVS